ncbi:hypothetical protein BXZ70DRAFT_891081, partial [Cristinia sonorae]
ITFTVASHEANPVHIGSRLPTSTPYDLLDRTWASGNKEFSCKELLQSSFPAEKEAMQRVKPQTNGFVHTVIDAYNDHHHLVLRPDDVWTAILSQFNFYVNAHAEELRSAFVQHEGKKKLVVKAIGTRYTVDFGYLATVMTQLIHANVVDKDLKDWILPNFSTTSANDTVVCAVLMMSTLKAYFSYGFELSCGIPSVTLEGTQADWDLLLSRLDKLATFGPEPSAFAQLLRPVLSRFSQAFTNASTGAPQDLDFWGRVAHFSNMGSGPTYLSGWITAFCVWNAEGQWRGPQLPLPVPDDSIRRESRQDSKPMKLVLDGVHYHYIDSAKVPAGYCEVDVELNDNGELFDCAMVSGHLATKVEGDKKDTVRPLPGWFMFSSPPTSGRDGRRQGITFTVAKHKADSVDLESYGLPIAKPRDILHRTWARGNRETSCKELLQTSFPSKREMIQRVKPQLNGFVHTVLDAYSNHHHLVLRPDDVWIAILSQFNFYINAHTEELRSSFVQHEGKKKLLVRAIGSRYTVNFGSLAGFMTDKIDENLVDKSLKDWILPKFSTTSNTDTVVCAVLMMSTLKAYFSYSIQLYCGIPSVTLEGTKSDWDLILSRLDKLVDYGSEPAAFAKLLHPILSRFSQAFTNGDNEVPQDIEFWTRVAHLTGGSGPIWLSGWITAFCVWDADGRWQGPELPLVLVDGGVAPPHPERPRSYATGRLVLDAVAYNRIDSKKVPSGYCEVDVELDDNGTLFDCMMVAGNLATKIGGELMDTVRPFPGWFIFVKEKWYPSEKAKADAERLRNLLL